MKNAKKIYALALAAAAIFLLCSCGNGTRTEDILEGDKVVGKSYYEKDKLVKEEFTDENGQISRFTQYGQDGNVSQKGVNEYNADGTIRTGELSSFDGDRLVKKDVTYYEAGKAVSARNVKYSYNEDGSVLEAVAKDGKKISEVLRDSDGNKLYSTAYEENGSVKTSYDGENIVRSETFDKEGKSEGYTQMQYGENGKASTSATYNGAGELVMTTVYKYAENGKISEILMYDASGKLYQTGTYDSDGKLTLK